MDGDIACVAPLPLRRLLFKFSREELLDMAERLWKCRESLTSPGKRALIDELLATRFHVGMTNREIAEIERYGIEKGALPGRKWTALKITQRSGAQPTTETTALLDDFRKRLSAYYRVYLCWWQREDSVLVRACMLEGANRYALPSAVNVIYLVHYPHAPLILATPIRAEHRKFFLQSLLAACHGDEIKELGLSGNSPESLASLVLHQHSQGPYAALREGGVDDNPLARRPKKRKRKEDEPTEPERPGRHRIVEEDAAVNATTRAMTDRAFGTTALPTLERVEFKVDVPFVDGETSIAPFAVRVVFSGTSVLEGVRALSAAGLAVGNALPRHLTDLPSAARSTFVISQLDAEGHAVADSEGAET